MKRRQAIRNIALISSAAAFMPACNLTGEQAVYENIPLDSEQLQLVEWLTSAILPKGELEIQTPETTPRFVLGMINDCFDPKDIQKYLTGLKIFAQYVQDEYQTSYKSLNPEQHILLFSKIMQSEVLPKSLRYFLSTTKQLSIRHFTSSEYFMKNYLDYEFVPGRYSGCVNL